MEVLFFFLFNSKKFLKEKTNYNKMMNYWSSSLTSKRNFNERQYFSTGFYKSSRMQYLYFLIGIMIAFI